MQFILTHPHLAREVARFTHQSGPMVPLTRAFKEAASRIEASRGTLEFALANNRWQFKLDCFSDFVYPWKSQDLDEPLMSLVRRAQFLDKACRLCNGLPEFPWPFLLESVSSLSFSDWDMAPIVLKWDWASLTHLTLDVPVISTPMEIQWPVSLKSLDIKILWRSSQDPVFSGLPHGLEVLIYDGTQTTGMHRIVFQERLPPRLRVLMIKAGIQIGYRYTRLIQVVPEEDFPSLEETNVVCTHPGGNSYFCPRVKKSLHALDGEEVVYFPMPELQKLYLSHFSSFEDRDGRKGLPLLAPNVTFLSEVRFLESCSCSFSRLKYLNVDYWDMRFAINKDMPKTLEGFRAELFLTHSRDSILNLDHFPATLKILILSISCTVTKVKFPKNIELCVLKVPEARSTLELEIPEATRWFFVSVWNSGSPEKCSLDVNRQPVYSRLSVQRRMILAENLTEHPNVRSRYSWFDQHRLSSGKGPDVPEPENLDEARELLELGY